MIVGITYERAARELWGNRTPRSITSGPLEKALSMYGITISARGRISGTKTLDTLAGNALIKGYAWDSDAEMEYPHWMVWDHAQKVIRDPLGYRYPIRVTSYRLLTRNPT
jgi:hypothetical protein